MISNAHEHCEFLVNGKPCREHVAVEIAGKLKEKYGKVLCYEHDPKWHRIQEKYGNMPLTEEY